MKIIGHVTRAEDCGDDIRVTIQGRAKGAATWRPYGDIALRMPGDDQTRMTYRLGREVVLEITPQ